MGARGWGVGSGLLNGQIPLSVTKVICRQSVKVVGCVTLMELSQHIFWGDFQRNFSFEQMFREEHYHMTIKRDSTKDSYLTKQL